jgi:hypothetical protein
VGAGGGHFERAAGQELPAHVGKVGREQGVWGR